METIFMLDIALIIIGALILVHAIRKKADQAIPAELLRLTPVEHLPKLKKRLALWSGGLIIGWGLAGLASHFHLLP